MTDTERIDALEQLLKVETQITITRVGSSIDITFRDLGKTAHTYALRQCLDAVPTAVGDVIARKLLGKDFDRLYADWP